MLPSCSVRGRLPNCCVMPPHHLLVDHGISACSWRRKACSVVPCLADAAGSSAAQSHPAMEKLHSGRLLALLAGCAIHHHASTCPHALHHPTGR